MRTSLLKFQTKFKAVVVKDIPKYPLKKLKQYFRLDFPNNILTIHQFSETPNCFGLFVFFSGKYFPCAYCHCFLFNNEKYTENGKTIEKKIESALMTLSDIPAFTLKINFLYLFFCLKN